VYILGLSFRFKIKRASFFNFLFFDPSQFIDNLADFFIDDDDRGDDDQKQDALLSFGKRNDIAEIWNGQKLFANDFVLGEFFSVGRVVGVALGLEFGLSVNFIFGNDAVGDGHFGVTCRACHDVANGIVRHRFDKNHAASLQSRFH